MTIKEPFLIDDYELIQVIGHGSFSQITLEKNKKNGQLVAMKQFFQQNHDDLDQADFMREIAILGVIHHPCITNFYGFSYGDIENPQPKYAMEYFKNGSVETMLSLTGTQKSIICLGVLSALTYLHENAIKDGQILHRDLKPSNIFLDNDLYPKLGDFGFAKVIYQPYHHTMFRGSYPWMAPEVMLSNNYGTPSDVYSFGCVLYNLITGFPPFPNFQTSGEYIEHVGKKGERPILPELDESLHPIIYSCWEQDPKKRPTFHQILKEFVNCKSLFNNTNLIKFQEYANSIGYTLFEA